MKHTSFPQKGPRRKFEKTYSQMPPANEPQVKKESKSKTFHKQEDFGKVADWILAQFETNDYQPEGTDWSGGQPGPHDPVCELKHKYVVQIIKIEE